MTNEIYKYCTLCGIVWGSEQKIANNFKLNYYCTGRYNGGIFVTCVKHGGTAMQDPAFAWENSQQNLKI